MHADVLIVGQGLAGTLLAWELEHAGISFQIADAGHGWAASRIAGAVINPITGPQIVKSWRIDALLPLARATYRALGRELGVALWRDMRVRRLYLSEQERRIVTDQQTSGDLSNYVEATDADGFWIEGAGCVDLPALITAARAHWHRRGKLVEECVSIETAAGQHGLVIACGGAELRPTAGEPARLASGQLGGRAGAFGFVRWQYSKGECLVGRTERLDPDVVVNRRHWLLPLENGRALVGATHAPGRSDSQPTAAARAELEASAAAMTPEPFATEEHWAGVRVYVADKKPVAGRHPANSRLGVMNGLGSKGALVAPWLARQWARHLAEGASFEREIDVARWWRGPVRP